MAYPTDDLPFFLDLKSIHGHDSVKCEQLLRDLPGKRKVFRGFLAATRRGRQTFS